MKEERNGMEAKEDERVEEIEREMMAVAEMVERNEEETTVAQERQSRASELRGFAARIGAARRREAHALDLAKWRECLDFSSRAHRSGIRIYNIIRSVGSGRLTADNALHQLVEDYHDLRELGKAINDFACTLRKGGEG